MLTRFLQSSVALIPWQARTAIKHIPLVAPLQRWLLTTGVARREFVHTVDAGPARGLRYPICLPQDKSIWTGTYELDFTAALTRAIAPGDVCLDIGGWHGFFSGVMALAGAKQVYVFEPLPANCGQIRKLIELNPQLRIQLFEEAIGERDGAQEFCIMPESSMGKLAASPFQPEASATTRIQVPAHSLDGLLAVHRIETPDVVKVDVEGAEALVLRGAARLLAGRKPRLFIEIHSRDLARECAALLDASGYHVIVIETSSAPDFSTEPEVCHYAARFAR